MVKVVAVQMLFKPAVIEKDVDYLAEPSIYNAKNGGSISALRKKTSDCDVEVFMNGIRETYEQYLSIKIHDLIEQICSLCNPDIILFPEYSIPYQCLPKMAELAQKYSVTIVAGTHMITLSAQTYYELSGLNIIDLHKKNGMAIAPILKADGQNDYQLKMTQSIFETTLVKPENQEVKCFTITTKSGETITFSILVCIDALRQELRGLLTKNKKEKEGILLLVPAYSPSTEDFFNNAESFSMEGITMVCCNTSLFGDSGMYIPQNVQFRFKQSSDEKARLVKNEEAVIKFEFELDGMFTKKGIIDDRIIGSYSIYPICYDDEYSWKGNYNALCEKLNNMLGESDLFQVEEEIDSFLLGNENVPSCIKRNLEIFRKKLCNYSGNKEELVQGINMISVSTYDTKILFGNEVQDSISFCGCKGSIAQEQMMTLLKEADLYKAQKMPPLEIKHQFNMTRKEVPESVINAFRGRGAYISELQELMNSDECKCIIINGAYGIGKTSFVDVTFQKHYPDWSIHRLCLPTTIRFAMVLEYLGAAVGIRISADTIARSSKRVMQPILRRLAEKIYEVPKRCIVIDDMASVLANADGRDLNIIDYFFKALEDVTVRKGKLILIGSIWFPEQILSKRICRQITIKELDKKNIERIIIYEMRTKEMVHTEQPPEIPEQILKIVKGHPLSAKLVVEILRHNTKASFDEIDTNLCRRDLITRLTTMIDFNVKEKSILILLSVFRTIVDVSKLLKILDEEVYENNKEGLNELKRSPYVNFDGETIELVEVFRIQFYEELRKMNCFHEYHELALKYYKELYDEMQKNDIFIPMVYAEMTYHYLVLGKIDELKTILDGNREALKLHAKTIYQRYKEYAAAFEVYQMLDEVYADDAEVLSYLGRCSARLNHWNDVSEYFNRAIGCAKDRKEETWYLYRDWAHILIRYSRIEEGEEKLKEARNLLKMETEKDEDAAILATQGYILDLRGETEDAIEKYEEAIKCVKNHGFAIHYYSKLLMRIGERDKARELRERIIPQDDIEPINRFGQYEFLSRNDELDDADDE